MAEYVGEYTLDFFTLLNAKCKKELIEWCMKEGLIASSYARPKCDERMRLYERKRFLRNRTSQVEKGCKFFTLSLPSTTLTEQDLNLEHFLDTKV
ncbi:hypothetical protein TNCV_3574991 [Trichonephila clavipes]|nr:hypothetical protein TNCV_3574991 [Trichonephila clavipes]